ncbi:hypothetical protein HOY82DRAFT_646844 [Tuber indicum]|nr:hypothetical protein HOY82DRAFT_646844 [Tuber indicum]
MAEYNYSHDAATVFLNALLADLLMAKAGSQSRALMRKPELIGELGEGAERGSPVRDLCDGVERDIHVKISESKDTSPASCGVTSHLPGVAVASPQAQRPVQKGNEIVANKMKRLPRDTAAQLEDRISEDLQGDMEALMSLIEEQRKLDKLDDVGAVYERFFLVFPAAADQWISYAKLELEHNELQHVERIFPRSLFNAPNVKRWSKYLDYIRRQNNLTRDTGGNVRVVVNRCYEFVLNYVGFDREAGRIWTEYIEFVKGSPGAVGGSSWQDQQKMDTLRKVYQRAVTMPVQGVELLWKVYNQLEQVLNKLTAKKHLQEYSPLFMTARYCLIELSNITKGLRVDTPSRLPPAP